MSAARVEARKVQLLAIHCCGSNILYGADRWNGARCPELVAGSGKQVEVVVMSNDVQEYL